MDWKLSGSKDQCVTCYLNTSYITRQEEGIKAKAVFGTEVAATHISHDRRMPGYFCGLVMFVFLSVFRHDYGVVFLS